MQTFRFSFAGGPVRLLLAATGVWQRSSYVTVDAREVRVRSGIAFRTTIPRSHLGEVARRERRVFSRGVHGSFGRWLVNGSSEGLVRLTVDPKVRAWMLCFPSKLRELTVSLEDPDGFLRALGYERW